MGLFSPSLFFLPPPSLLSFFLGQWAKPIKLLLGFRKGSEPAVLRSTGRKRAAPVLPGWQVRRAPLHCCSCSSPLGISATAPHPVVRYVSILDPPFPSHLLSGPCCLPISLNVHLRCVAGHSCGHRSQPLGLPSHRACKYQPAWLLRALLPPPFFDCNPASLQKTGSSGVQLARPSLLVLINHVCG